eukprot:CAMPEP_0113323066 /NCGR_PEP_ID=MMETSP0010_2-20120614/16035_1 /TAXON_ID=216773 ORGANISM="Corethron hystrix, Strain 308" /NCGR_SAMPLE_ID=MMETSP0010_2 /ASSEMBLY_ACC=CAM_ASM_000155 /LENGTH=419 /DNA_ID=CAMNT_0000181797 /DNA_START=55 /DNA_END=1310 /DNA_ORIENTATION=- /assembly_acc=CAM_ASM_000155
MIYRVLTVVDRTEDLRKCCLDLLVEDSGDAGDRIGPEFPCAVILDLADAVVIPEQQRHSPKKRRIHTTFPHVFSSDSNAASEKVSSENWDNAAFSIFYRIERLASYLRPGGPLQHRYSRAEFFDVIPVLENDEGTGSAAGTPLLSTEKFETSTRVSMENLFLDVRSLQRAIVGDGDGNADVQRHREAVAAFLVEQLSHRVSEPLEDMEKFRKRENVIRLMRKYATLLGGGVPNLLPVGKNIANEDNAVEEILSLDSLPLLPWEDKMVEEKSDHLTLFRNGENSVKEAKEHGWGWEDSNIDIGIDDQTDDLGTTEEEGAEGKPMQVNLKSYVDPPIPYGRGKHERDSLGRVHEQNPPNNDVHDGRDTEDMLRREHSALALRYASEVTKVQDVEHTVFSISSLLSQFSSLVEEQSGQVSIL